MRRATDAPWTSDASRRARVKRPTREHIPRDSCGPEPSAAARRRVAPDAASDSGGQAAAKSPKPCPASAPSPMASVPRSSRRAEGPRQATLCRARLQASHVAPPGAGASAGAAAETPDRDAEARRPPKKPRIAVELLARLSPVDGADVADAATVADQGSLTKHRAKVVNGIKHELDRLQPAAASTEKSQRRKLRSQDATRFKSELSAYFPDYDKVIGNDPKEQHLLNPDTPIVIVDTARCLSAAPQPPPCLTSSPHPPDRAVDSRVRGYGNSLFTDVFDAQRIDFSFLETQHNLKSADDPLPDSLFKPVHKRAQRMERSIRNTEKGRAQHEKDQIIRLLDDLQGHDWLRVMGVSGVTETRKKTFEPARAHFIRGCQSILDKFRNWSLEERRRKQEKERAHAQQAAADEEKERRNEEERGRDGGAGREGRLTLPRDLDPGSAASLESGSETSSPAQLLGQEAPVGAPTASPTTTGPRKPRAAAARPMPSSRLEPVRELKSFFRKRYEHDGAINQNRRTGRKVLAWGHPLPDMEQGDFNLPEEYRNEDTLKARARKKRRDKRGRRP